jgi:hypothetical protein
VTQLPLVCNLGALTPQQRQRRAELAARLGASVERVEETAGGYVLHVPAAALEDAEELLALESHCCSFLTLDLRRDDLKRSATLQIDGPEGAKPFIEAELGELIARKG